MKNAEIALLFEKTADVLAVKGENSFKILAFRKVARALEEMATDVEAVAREGKLEEVPGIGEGSAKRIQEYLRSGKIAEFIDLWNEVPAGVMEMMRIPGMGPKTAALFWQEGGVTTLEQLKAKLAAADFGGLDKLAGMGAKKLEKIKTSMAYLATSAGRMQIGVALPLAEVMVEYLREIKGVEAVQYCGSLRRAKETIGDIDIAVAAKEKFAEEISHAVTRHPMTAEVIGAGGTKTSIRTARGLQVDVRVVPPESFGAAVQYFTGSKEHNVKLREIAIKRGMKLSDWGLFKLEKDGEKMIAGRTEEEIYAALDMVCLPPEMRENKGEIELAQELWKKNPDISQQMRDKTWLHKKENKEQLLENYFAEQLTSCKVYYTEREGKRISDDALEAFEAGLMLSFPDPEPRTKKRVTDEWSKAIPRINSKRPETWLGKTPGEVQIKFEEFLRVEGLWDQFLQCVKEFKSSDKWMDCRTAEAQTVVCKQLEKKQGVYAFKNRVSGIGAGYVGKTGKFKPAPTSTSHVRDRIHEHFTDKYASTNYPVIDNFPAAFLREELFQLDSERAEDSAPQINSVFQRLEIADIRGDLHMHTVASDGTLSIEEMVAECKRRGYQYCAITDHSKSQFQANGLTVDRLLKHIEAIHAVAREVKGILVLAGSEVDILADGSLDYEDEVLAKLDWVVASPHAALTQETEAATQRLVRVAANPHVHVIGHPTGRLVPSRKGLEPDMAKVVFAAARHGVALELNSHYMRLDLRDVHLKLARDAGVPICIDTDAHGLADFEQLRYGILTARRGWLQKENVLNTRPVEDFKKWLKGRKEQAAW